MKAYKFVSFYISILLVFFLLGCGDNIKPIKEDLDKYPWIKTFTPGMKHFKGINHNIDLGTFSFAFESKYPMDIFFNKVDSKAVKEGWNIIYENDNGRIYKRYSKIYDRYDNFDYVNLIYTDVIIFKFEMKPE
jgi:hypothetical protein